MQSDDGLGCSGVLGDVGEGLGDDEVGGHLDRGREALAQGVGDADRDGGALGEARTAGPSPESERTAGWMPRARSRSS